MTFVNQIGAGEVAHAITQFPHRDGETLIDVEAFGAPVFVGDDLVAELIIIHDIRERIQTEDALRGQRGGGSLYKS